jgi:hypothetical protein
MGVDTVQCLMDSMTETRGNLSTLLERQATAGVL